MKILITSAASAEAYRLRTKLTAEGHEVMLGDYHDLPSFMTGMLKLPNPASPSYQHEMLTLCLDNGIGIISALETAELELLHQSEQLFSEYEITLKDGRDGL